MNLRWSALTGQLLETLYSTVILSLQLSQGEFIVTALQDGGPECSEAGGSGGWMEGGERQGAPKNNLFSQDRNKKLCGGRIDSKQQIPRTLTWGHKGQRLTTTGNRM